MTKILSKSYLFENLFIDLKRCESENWKEKFLVDYIRGSDDKECTASFIRHEVHMSNKGIFKQSRSFKNGDSV